MTIKTRLIATAFWLSQASALLWLSLTRETLDKTNQLLMHEAFWLALLCLIFGRTTLKLCFAVLILGFLTSWSEIFNTLHKHAMDWLDLDYYRPQDGPALAGTLIMVALVVRLFWFRSMRAAQVGSSLIAAGFFCFWTFVHFAMIFPMLDNMTASTSRLIKAEVASRDFTQMCARHHGDPGHEPLPTERRWTCVENSVGHSLPDWASDLAGVNEIQQWARESGDQYPVVHAWTSNLREGRNIDSPLKHVAYLQHNGSYRLIVDWTQYQLDKNKVMTIAGRFFTAFGIVWLIGGLMLIRMHERRFALRLSAGQ